MQKKEHSSYSASFTAGSLLHREISALLPLLQSENPEQAIRDEIKNNHLLHINSESSRKRVVYEISKRAKNIYSSFWNYYGKCSEEEQKILLFYLCLKTYTLIFDFHFNVTVKQWHSSSQVIDPYFYQMELEEIATRDEQVDKWTDKTKRSTITVYMRMLKEITMSDTKNNLRSISLHESFWPFFIENREVWFLEACLLNADEKERIINL